MLALQGTLTVAPFHCISSSMDEYALESGHVSRSGSMEWRARAPTPRQHTSIQPQVSPQRADLASTMSSGERSLSKTLYRAHLYCYRGFTDQDSPQSTTFYASPSPTSRTFTYASFERKLRIRIRTATRIRTQTRYSTSTHAPFLHPPRRMARPPSALQDTGVSWERTPSSDITSRYNAVSRAPRQAQTPCECRERHSRPSDSRHPP